MQNSPISLPNEEESNYTCPICMYNIADTMLLPCHHKICSSCLLDWRGRTARSKQAGTWNIVYTFYVYRNEMLYLPCVNKQNNIIK